MEKHRLIISSIIFSFVFSVLFINDARGQENTSNSNNPKIKSAPADSIINSNYLNFATLIVDYDTHEFEGGNLSWYQKCSDCTKDSIPFDILVNQPMDFGDITYRIQNTMDTVFFGSIIWMGTGQIFHPENFSLEYPFNGTYIPAEKPDKIEYYNFYGDKVYDDSAFIKSADSAWCQIDSIEITKLFLEYNCNVGIYLYPPTVGMFNPYAAKWIIFLYLNDFDSAIPDAAPINQKVPFTIFPNPCYDYLNVRSHYPNNSLHLWEILDQRGELLIKGSNLKELKNIDVSILQPGIYILRIQGDEKTYSTRFIKF